MRNPGNERRRNLRLKSYDFHPNIKKFSEHGNPKKGHLSPADSEKQSHKVSMPLVGLGWRGWRGLEGDVKPPGLVRSEGSGVAS